MSKKTANNVMKATGILSITAFLSRILGYVRTIVISSTFGMSYVTDAYNASFTIPDMIYYCLVGGALSSAFIPVFSGYLAQGKDEEGSEMASTILNLVAFLAAILCILGEIFAPQLVNLLVSYTGETFRLTVLLTRIMFCQSFFMCLTGISQGILQSYKRFAIPAIGSVLYNITIIVLGLILATKFNLGIKGFSIGVVCGAIVNLSVQVVALRKQSFTYRPIIHLKHPGVKKFFVLLLPVLLGLSMNELNLLANQKFGSGLGESVLSALKNAQQIMQLPIGIFGSAIGLSIFPTMTEHYINGKIDEYKNDLAMSLRNVVFITLPCALGLIAVRVPIIRAMYRQGKFTDANVNQVATLLAFYCIGIVGYSAQQILNRGFYSSQDTKTPVRINIFILLLNILLSYIFKEFWGAPGLALAYSVSGLTSMVLLLFFLHKKVGTLHGREILRSVVKTCIATLVMFVAVSLLTAVLEHFMPLGRKIYQLVEVAILGCAGVGVFALAAYLLKMEEMRSVTALLKRKARRRS
jgi:putative peptidoglycan lipid II flippase